MKKGICLVLTIVALFSTLVFPVCATEVVTLYAAPTYCSRCGTFQVNHIEDTVYRQDVIRQGCENTSVTHYHYIDHYYHVYECQRCHTIYQNEYNRNEYCQVSMNRCLPDQQ